MAFTHTAVLNWSGPGNSSLSYSKQYSAGSEVNVDEAIADSETDKQVNFDIDQSALVLLYMVSDQDVLVEFGDGAGIQGSVSLKADVPYVWTSDTYDTLKITGDIGDMFVTNASGSTANLKVRALQDPTP